MEKITLVFVSLILMMPGEALAQPTKKIGIWMTIGGATVDDSTRRIGWGLPSSGWMGATVLKETIQTAIIQVRAAGFAPIVILHNPYGFEGGEVMDFDQRVELLENPKLTALRDFKKFLNKQLRPMVGIDGEVIVYLGSISADKDMLERENSPSKYAARVNQSIRLPDWVAIGADMSATLMPDSPGSFVWALRRATGQKIYIESRPVIGAALLGYPVICDEAFWLRSNPEVFPADAAKLYATNAQCGKDVMRFVFSHHGDTARREMLWKQIVADEHTPATTSNLIPELLASIANPKNEVIEK